jgi:hypothetical protein
MSSVPPGLSSLRLPLGNIVHYPTGRPSIRVLAREIAALGYEVLVFPLEHPDLRPLTLGVWRNCVVIGDFIICIVTPTAPSVFRIRHRPRAATYYPITHPTILTTY